MSEQKPPAASAAPRRAPSSRVSAFWRELRHRGLRPRDRLGYALAGLRPGERRSWLERRLQVDPERGWLFVLGVNNSGTTIFCRTLESHPQIRTLPKEGQFLTRAFPRASEFGVGRLWSLSPEVFHWTAAEPEGPALRAQFDWSRCYAPGDGYLLEKSPPNTLRSLWLQAHFRPASFVAIVRHPYAACEGMRRRSGCSLEDAARHWTQANRRLLEDLPGLRRGMRIRYEDLTGATEATLTTLETFLRLDPPLDRRAAGSVSAHSIDGRTTGLVNLNGRSVARLSTADLDLIDAIAGSVMEALDYDRENAA